MGRQKLSSNDVKLELFAPARAAILAKLKPDLDSDPTNLKVLKHRQPVYLSCKLEIAVDHLIPSTLTPRFWDQVCGKNDKETDNVKELLMC